MTGVAWYWARTELRRRWRAWLAVALLVGIGGGLSMASVAAARRTHSAYPRFLDWADAADLVVDPDTTTDTDSFRRAVRDLPGVVDGSDARAVALGLVGRDGEIDEDTVGYAIASVDGRRFYEHDRVLVTAGRLPDPARVDEALVDEIFASRRGVGVGDLLTYRVLDTGQLFASDFDVQAAAGRAVRVEVTGIGIFPELAVTEEEYAQSRVMLTPALHDVLPPTAHLWDRAAYDVAPGADIGQLRRRIQGLAQEAGGDVLFEDRAVITRRAQRAVRPYVLALAGVGIAGAAFVGLLAMQLVRRTVALARAEVHTLRALAADGRTTRLALLLPVSAAAAVASGVAALTAAALSPASPVGPVASIEPSPGLTMDWTVVGPGLVVVIAVLCLPVVVVGRVTAAHRPRARPARDRVVEWARRSGAPLSVVLGVGRATGAGGGVRRSSARAGMASVALGAVMLVAVGTFGASVKHLLDNPEIHGWNADVALLDGGGYGNFDLERAATVEGVRGLTAGVFGAISVDGTNVPGVGMTMLRGSLLPPIVDGRQPLGPGEIVLGTTTLDDLGGDVGDVLDVRMPGESIEPMTVVGTAVFPGLGPLDNDRPTLGEGAMVVLPPEVAAEMDLSWSLLTVDLERGASQDDVTRALTATSLGPTGDTVVLDVVRPVDVAAFADLGAVPVVFLALFGTVAAGSLAHVLLVSARAWRRDRAVLAALGLAPGQLRSATRWQAMTLVTTAVVVAVPVGISLGRWAWRSLAVEIGIVPETAVPALALAGLVFGLLVAGGLAASIPDRRGSHRHPAHELRTE